MDCLIEFTGPDHLVEAIQVVQKPELDLVVVRNLVSKDIAQLLSGKIDDRWNTLFNESGAPWREAHSAVEKIWEERGYTGYEMADAPYLKGKYENIDTHVDTGVIQDQIPVVAMGSLCLLDRTFWAERLPGHYKRGALHERGSFDWHYFQSCCDRQTGSLVGPRIEAGWVPRTRADLKPGDLALFAHHPAIVAHKAHAQPKEDLWKADGMLIGWWGYRIGSWAWKNYRS